MDVSHGEFIIFLYKTCINNQVLKTLWTSINVHGPNTINKILNHAKPICMQTLSNSSFFFP